MRIVITGPAEVYDLDDEEITDAEQLAKLDGLKSELTADKYFEESLDEIGITGGAVQLAFDKKAKQLKVVSEDLSPRKLTKKELALLIEETTGQWSDGIGEGCFDDYCDKHAISINLRPLGSSDDDVRVEQSDDGAKPVKKRKSPLFNVAKKGDVAKIEKLLDGGEDPSPKDRYGMTPLHIAIREGQTEAVRILIERGADIECFDEMGFSPLTCAAVWPNLEIVELLLDKGADINRQLIDDTGEHSGYAPLMMACNRKNFDIAKLLVERGADVNIRDVTGYTPLMQLKPGDVEFGRYLVDRGADLHAKNRLGAGVSPKLKKSLE